MPDNCKCVRTVHGQHLSEQHNEKSQSFPRLKAPLCYFNETGFRRSGTHTPLVPTDWVAPRSALLDLPISQPNLTCPHHHSPHSPQYSCCLVGGRFLLRGGERRSVEPGKPYRLSPNKFSLRQGHRRLSASFLWACASRHIDCRSSCIQKTSAHPMTGSSGRPQQLNTEVAGSWERRPRAALA